MKVVFKLFQWLWHLWPGVERAGLRDQLRECHHIPCFNHRDLRSQKENKKNWEGKSNKSQRLFYGSRKGEKDYKKNNQKAGEMEGLGNYLLHSICLVQKQLSSLSVTCSWVRIKQVEAERSHQHYSKLQLKRTPPKRGGSVECINLMSEEKYMLSITRAQRLAKLWKLH